MESNLTTHIICKKCHGRNPGQSLQCLRCGDMLTSEQTPTQETRDEMVGRLIDNRFRILDRIGEGGMATVYRAHQISVNREVALKVMKQKYLKNRQLKERFLREAVLASRLNHPNTITIYDLGQSDEHGLYIAMELVDGVTLKHDMDTFKRIAWRRACRLGVQICNSLQDAHEHNIVHRDLKPGNIMLTYRGYNNNRAQIVKVLDFGLAIRVTQNSGYVSDDLLGTPEYMSPEQISGIKLDHRSDIYSLGIILYKMLTGQMPFKVRTPIMVMNHHLSARPRSFAELGPDFRTIPEGLEDLVLWMLSKDRRARPKSMNEVAIMLNVLQKDRSRGFPGFTPSRGIPVGKNVRPQPFSKPSQLPPIPLVAQQSRLVAETRSASRAADEPTMLPSETSEK